MAGVVVHLLESIERLDPETPVVVASHRLLGPMDRFRVLPFANVAPLAALQAMAPEDFTPHMFYDGWCEDLYDNRDQYAWLMEAFADDASRRALDAILGFRQTLDVQVLRPTIDWDVYCPAGLFTLGPDEVYVDGGAYEGDTISFFIDRVQNRFARAIGFEPDPATYRNLKANFEDDERVEAVERGLSDATRVLVFDDAGTRGSALSEGGGIEVPVTALDEFLGGDRVSYIKMNIEGAELDALRGARKAIGKWHPRLAISAYHRPTDLWQVPRLMHKLRPDYALYMRQHDGGVIETVAYGI